MKFAEMASDKNRENKGFTEMVRKRITELRKINSGNACETPAPDRNAFEFGEILNNEMGETPESRDSPPRVNVPEHSSSSALVGGNDVSQISEKINKMDAEKKQQCLQQVELMSNIAASLIQLQESMSSNNNS